MTTSEPYFMEDPREAKRLIDKVDAEAWVQRYLLARLGGAGNVLDVACGPGAIASAVAIAQPCARVAGIDLCANRFPLSSGVCLPKNVRLQEADARSLPFSENSFDIVYCRFLLEYLAERELAVSEMVRVCKSGGRVLLQDLDGQLVWHFPEDIELQDQITRVLTGLARTGFDPFVGRKLYSLARTAGLEEIEVTAESYHLFAGRIDDDNLRLWETKLDIAMPTAAKVLGNQDAALSLKARFLEYLKRDDTLTYSILFTVVGRKGL